MTQQSLNSYTKELILKILHENPLETTVAVTTVLYTFSRGWISWRHHHWPYSASQWAWYQGLFYLGTPTVPPAVKRT